MQAQVDYCYAVNTEMLDIENEKIASTNLIKNHLITCQYV